jgi:uncharacterized SAM-binding protein YcdF (DUF218 family)
MLFLLSKTLGLVLEPCNFGLLLLGVALLLRTLHRAERLRRYLIIFALFELWLLSTGIVADQLLCPLETRYRRPDFLPRSPAAIVMLGGVINPYGRGQGYELNEAADRFVEAVRLAHLYPSSLLVIAAGSSALLPGLMHESAGLQRLTEALQVSAKRGALSPDDYREADTLARLARELGIGAARLRIDRESRNTHENAVESGKLLRGIKGPVLLVTSASHLRRAVACFEKIGLKVIPWPVDYQLSRGFYASALVPSPHALVKSTIALREYLGGR